MARDYQIKPHQLRPNEVVAVRGTVVFSRIASLIDGEELIKANQRTKSNMRPHTTITISNARVVPKDPSGTMSMEETYVNERIYTSTAKAVQAVGGSPLTYSARNATGSLPLVGILESANNVQGIFLEHELAQGLDVTLYLNSFKATPNNGIGLNMVVINEPLRYANTYGVESILSQFNLRFTPAPVTPKPAPTQEQVPFNPYQMQQTTNPYANVQVTTNPYTVQPSMNNQPQPAIQNPYQNVSQQANGYLVNQPEFPTFNQQMPPNGQIQTPPPSTQGIVFSPNLGGRNY